MDFAQQLSGNHMTATKTSATAAAIQRLVQAKVNDLPGFRKAGVTPLIPIAVPFDNPHGARNWKMDLAHLNLLGIADQVFAVVKAAQDRYHLIGG
jgi:hypothetical protein